MPPVSARRRWLAPLRCIRMASSSLTYCLLLSTSAFFCFAVASMTPRIQLSSCTN